MTAVQLLRLPAVIAATGLSRSTIYLREQRGEFPKRVKLGASTAWPAHEVEAWVRARIAERGPDAAA